MTTTPAAAEPERIERWERALCEADGYDPDTDFLGESRCKAYRAIAREAISLADAEAAAQSAPDATPAQPSRDINPGISAIEPAKPVRVDYINFRGERGNRHIIPNRIVFGSTEYHPEPQWLMEAYDLDKKAVRVFALEDMRFLDDAATPAQPVSAAGSEPVAWRDISSARMDGTSMFIWHPMWKCGPQLGYYDEASAWWRIGDRKHWLGVGIFPSHWHPTPEAPRQVYATPTPALAPQDGGLRAAAHDLVEARKRGALLSHRFRALEAALATPSEPDVLPGLKLAYSIADEFGDRRTRAAIGAEIEAGVKALRFLFSYDDEENFREEARVVLAAAAAVRSDDVTTRLTEAADRVAKAEERAEKAEAGLYSMSCERAELQAELAALRAAVCGAIADWHGGDSSQTMVNDLRAAIAQGEKP